jgi:predicted RNA-binding Zn ribbon-like protein
MSEGTAPGALELVRRLVNTLDVESGADELAAPGGLTAFADAQGLSLPPDSLTEVRRLREALRAALLAHTGTDVPPARLAELDALLEAAPLVLHLDATGAAALRPAAGLHGVSDLTARVAAALATGQVAGTWQRLKACRAHDCLWAYYDRSPAGRRRWCSMQVCGSRSKMREYRARRRP